MTSKFNFILVVWLFTFTAANAQVPATTAASIDGSPYLNEAYVEGVIYYKDKNYSAPIRYNAYADLIEYQQNGTAMVLDPSPTIKKVCFGTFTFIPAVYELSGKPKLGYFAVLDSGKVTLLSKKKIIFLDAKKGGALDGTDQPAQYKPFPDEFYFKVGNGKLQEVSSIKSMISNLPDKQDQLEQFAKKEKISPKKEKEIVQLVKYYNSL